MRLIAVDFAMQIKLPRVNSGFFLYLIFSISLYSYIFMETLKMGIYTFDDLIGWGRLFPTDIIFYNNTIMDFNLWDRNTLVLWVINSADIVWIYSISFMIMQVIFFKIYKFINGNNLFLVLIILLNLNLFSVYPNKDFYSIISIGFFVVYIYNENRFYLWLSMFTAFISRPEMLLIMYFCALTMNFKCKKYIFLSILITISFFYADLPGYESYEAVLINGRSENSFNIAELINNLSKDYYLYWLIFPFKLILTLRDAGFYYFMIVLLLIINSLQYKIYFDEKVEKLIYLLSIFMLYSTYPSFIHFRYVSPGLLVLLVIFFQIRMSQKNIRTKLIAC